MDVQKLTQDELIHRAAAALRLGHVTSARADLHELLQRFGVSAMHDLIVGNVSNDNPSMVPIRDASYGIFEHGTLYDFQPSTAAEGSTFYYNGKQWRVVVNQTFYNHFPEPGKYAHTKFLAIAVPAVPHVDDDHARHALPEERDERPFHIQYFDEDGYSDV